ncbi:MAG: hypothetical protein GKR90_16215 [Pseudomonadales bacterium]|nr:hypothetical protein [Pseudomonadales bacterium]
MHQSRYGKRAAVALAFGLFLIVSACDKPSTYNQAEASLPVTYKLPISINDVMVALVNDAADPIWMAAWQEPKTDEEWRELERKAYQLQLAGSLIAHPGTGALDHKWTAKPGWQQWSNQLHATGVDAIAAVENRDLAAIGNIGDQLVEVCEGCHRDFKLPFPTGGKFGELSPVPSE